MPDKETGEPVRADPNRRGAHVVQAHVSHEAKAFGSFRYAFVQEFGTGWESA